MQTIEQKYEELGRILREMDRVVVAFSGGVDSAFLLKAALEFLGPERVLAITADSETYPVREKEEAILLAKELNAPHEVIHTSELDIPGYAENPTNRCYFCKNSLFEHLIPIAEKKAIITLYLVQLPMIWENTALDFKLLMTKGCERHCWKRVLKIRNPPSIPSIWAAYMG